MIVKFFLAITKEEQKKRFEKLLDNPQTAWRVTKGDQKRNREYRKFLRMNEEMLEKTDTDYAPWFLVEANDRRFAAIKILTEAVRRLEEALEAKKAAQEEKEAESADDKHRVTADASRGCRAESVKKEHTDQAPSCETSLRSSRLASVDLTKTMDKKEYQEQLKRPAAPAGASAQRALPDEDPGDPGLRGLGCGRKRRRHQAPDPGHGSQRLRGASDGIPQRY